MNFLPGWMPAATRNVNFPVVVSTNVSHQNTVGTSHTVNLPASLVAGNLIIIVFGNFTSTITVSISGYTQLATQTCTNGGTSNGRLTILYKTATGSEGSTVTATTAGAPGNTVSSHNSYQISGWIGTPEAATTNGNDSNPNPPSLTPTWGRTKTLWLATSNSDRSGATHTISTYPSGYSGGIQDSGVVAVANTSTTTGSAWIQTDAASVDPGTFALSASVPWAVATIGIQPQ